MSSFHVFDMPNDDKSIQPHLNMVGVFCTSRNIQQSQLQKVPFSQAILSLGSLFKYLTVLFFYA